MSRRPLCCRNAPRMPPVARPTRPLPYPPARPKTRSIRRRPSRTRWGAWHWAPPPRSLPLPGAFHEPARTLRPPLLPMAGRLVEPYNMYQVLMVGAHGAGKGGEDVGAGPSSSATTSSTSVALVVAGPVRDVAPDEKSDKEGEKKGAPAAATWASASAAHSASSSTTAPRSARRVEVGGGMILYLERIPPALAPPHFLLSSSRLLSADGSLARFAQGRLHNARQGRGSESHAPPSPGFARQSR